jgi:replicative DNA helicase
VTIPFDPVNEQIVLAASMVDDEVRDKLVGKLKPTSFLIPLHRQVWVAFTEMARQHLAYDPATAQQLLGQGFDTKFLTDLQDSRPDLPPNLDYHVAIMQWDQARLKSVTGPIAQLLEAVKDNRTDPAKVRGLARAVAGSFDGYEDRKFLRDSQDVILCQIEDIKARMNGRSCYSCGIEALDTYESGHKLSGQPRLIPGFAPGKISVVCGVPGGGKSTFTTKMIGGLAKQKKRVLVGAWEMTAGEILELAACQELGFSRHDFSIGNVDVFKLAKLHQKMEELSEFVKFMDIPFNRNAGEKKSNDANLDLVQGYISDVAPDVFVADLFKRCLRYTQPDDEEQALVRVQAMFQELHVHGVLVQQLRAKDVESRADKRPTRESIKGSGAWIEVPDNIFGIHRPGIWKAIPDDHMDVLILKQRFGEWPMVVQFDFDKQRGHISGGITVPYEYEEKKEKDSFLDDEEDFEPKKKKKSYGNF